MREGWVKCKFKEAFDLQMGKTPSRDNPDYWGNNNIWVSISDMTKKYIDSSKEGLTDLAVTSTGIKRVKAGTVIMSFKLSVGKVSIASKDLYTNEAIMAFKVLQEKQNEISPEYTYYYLKGYKWEGTNKAVMGVTLNKASISANNFSYPPLTTQQQIVSELDLLTHILDQKRQQLKEYDALAESIFYDMFGDPVENPKGWEVLPLKSFGNIKTGNTPSRSNVSYYNQKDIEWIKTDNIIDCELYPTTAAEYLSTEGLNVGRKVKIGSLLVACIAGSVSSIGKCCITNREVAFNQQINGIEPNVDIVDIIYLYCLISNTKTYIQESATSGMKHILSKSTFEQICFPLPPLPLQQTFAAKIQSIEHQKQLLKESIKETEMLFQSRMDYWFNG